jgi:hypothetical protein
MTCRARSCAACGPRVVAAKVVTIPESLYAREIERADWPTLYDNLRDRRARGQAGDYARIPLDDTRLLIVSNANIGGGRIEREAVREFMLLADARDGQITASRAWQPHRDGAALRLRPVEVS